jgi:ABC-type multidrug transport system fused ATPase/permease subunit
MGEGIRFEHVSFAYPGTERCVLEDINLHLNPGSVVAIVGENGAGKTTLVKARGFMRERPLILVLDEPTAALDAETEHALFERYATAARGGPGAPSEPTPDSRITTLVSHRFSTGAHGQLRRGTPGRARG